MIVVRNEPFHIRCPTLLSTSGLPWSHPNRQKSADVEEMRWRRWGWAGLIFSGLSCFLCLLHFLVWLVAMNNNDHHECHYWVILFFFYLPFCTPYLALLTIFPSFSINRVLLAMWRTLNSAFEPLLLPELLSLHLFQPQSHLRLYNTNNEKSVLPLSAAGRLSHFCTRIVQGQCSDPCVWIHRPSGVELLFVMWKIL